MPGTTAVISSFMAAAAGGRQLRETGACPIPPPKSSLTSVLPTARNLIRLSLSLKSTSRSPFENVAVGAGGAAGLPETLATAGVLVCPFSQSTAVN